MISPRWITILLVALVTSLLAYVGVAAAQVAALPANAPTPTIAVVAVGLLLQAGGFWLSWLKSTGSTALQLEKLAQQMRTERRADLLPIVEQVRALSDSSIRLKERLADGDILQKRDCSTCQTGLNEAIHDLAVRVARGEAVHEAEREMRHTATPSPDGTR